MAALTAMMVSTAMTRVAEFIGTAAIERVAAGGTVVDPEVIHQLVQLRQDPLERLSAREREVLSLIAVLAYLRA